MNSSVIVEFDVDCDWESVPPRYRLYVNDELFTERTWIWQDKYLEEVIAISAPPGDYRIRYELVGQGRIFFANGKIIDGNAEIIATDTVRIFDETA